MRGSFRDRLAEHLSVLGRHWAPGREFEKRGLRCCHTRARCMPEEYGSRRVQSDCDGDREKQKANQEDIRCQTRPQRCHKPRLSDRYQLSRAATDCAMIAVGKPPIPSSGKTRRPFCFGKTAHVDRDPGLQPMRQDASRPRIVFPSMVRSQTVPTACRRPRAGSTSFQDESVRFRLRGSLPSIREGPKPKPATAGGQTGEENHGHWRRIDPTMLSRQSRPCSKAEDGQKYAKPVRTIRKNYRDPQRNCVHHNTAGRIVETSIRRTRESKR